MSANDFTENDCVDSIFKRCERREIEWHFSQTGGVVAQINDISIWVSEERGRMVIIRFSRGLKQCAIRGASDKLKQILKMARQNASERCESEEYNGQVKQEVFERIIFGGF